MAALVPMRESAHCFVYPTVAVIPFDLILTSFSGCEAAGERRSSKSAFSADLLLADGLLGNSSGSLLSCRIKARAC